jgi:hypothetical protein
VSTRALTLGLLKIHPLRALTAPTGPGGRCARETPGGSSRGPRL